MDKLFVCLANSYKHGGRCIAGVEVKIVDSKFEVVRSNFLPKWIRPVCRDTDAGAIPNQIAEAVSLFDVVKLTNVEECPVGAQRENAYFDQMTVTGYKYDSALIERTLMDNSNNKLFYNSGKAVAPEIYNLMGTYSIVLIKASEAEIYGETKYTDYVRYRMRFTYNHCQYDFPITDPICLENLRSDKITVGVKGDMYLTCSLGAEHEGWHSKLVAGVIELPAKQEEESCNDETKAYSVEEIRKTYTQAYAKWTAEADEELANLYDAGMSIEQMMSHFGRNRGSIVSRLRKIGKMPL